MLIGLSGSPGTPGHGPPSRSGQGQQCGDGGEAALPRAAVGLDKRPGRRAETRPRLGLREQFDERVFEFARPTPPGPPRGRRGTPPRSPRSSACAGRTRSACRRPPARGCCARRCRTRLPPTNTTVADLVDLRQLANRVEHDDVGARARRRSASSVRRTVRNPDCRASASTSAKRSGWRGARTSSAVVRERADPLERPQHDLVLALHRAARHDHRRARRPPRKKRSTRSAPRAARRRAGHLQRVELQAAGHGDPRRAVGAEVDRAAAPIPRSARRSGRCRASTRRNSGRTSR